MPGYWPFQCDRSRAFSPGSRAPQSSTAWRDTGLIRTSIPWKVPPALDNNTARVAEDSPCLIDKGTRLVLEEFEFARTGDLPGPVATWIARTSSPQDGP